MKTVFRSRISLLLSLIFWIVFLYGYFLIVKNFSVYHNAKLFVILLLYGLLIIFIGIIWFGTRYIIIGDKLIIKCGFIRIANIKIHDISAIRRTYNPLGSPAISLKRISIRLKHKSNFPVILISPKNEKQFLDLLVGQNPNIELNVPEIRKVYRFWDWDI